MIMLAQVSLSRSNYSKYLWSEKKAHLCFFIQLCVLFIFSFDNKIKE